MELCRPWLQVVMCPAFRRLRSRPGADAPKVNGHQMVVVGIFPKLGGASVFRTLRYLEATDPAVPSCGYIGDSCIHAL